MIRLDKALESAVAGASASTDIAKMRKASQGIEQIFIKQLISQMRKSMPGADKATFGMEMYEDLMNDALADSVSKRGDFGVAKQIQASMEPIFFRQELARVRRNAAIEALQDQDPATNEKV